MTGDIIVLANPTAEFSAIFVRVFDGAKRGIARLRDDIGIKGVYEYRPESNGIPLFFHVFRHAEWFHVHDVTGDVEAMLARARDSAKLRRNAARSADRARLRQARKSDATDWQEAHSPTAPVTIRITGQRQAVISRRRKNDARLWDAMSGFQQDAAEQIVLGFEMVSSGLGAKAADYERVVGRGEGKAPSKREVERMEDYWRWAKEVQVQRLSHAGALDILAFGESCRTVDSGRRKRKGWAMENLLDCLNIYCKLQGWPQNQVDNRGSVRH